MCPSTRGMQPPAFVATRYDDCSPSPRSHHHHYHRAPMMLQHALESCCRVLPWACGCQRVTSGCSQQRRGGRHLCSGCKGQARSRRASHSLVRLVGDSQQEGRVPPAASVRRTTIIIGVELLCPLLSSAHLLFVGAGISRTNGRTASLSSLPSRSHTRTCHCVAQRCATTAAVAAAAAPTCSVCLQDDSY